MCQLHSPLNDTLHHKTPFSWLSHLSFHIFKLSDFCSTLFYSISNLLTWCFILLLSILLVVLLFLHSPSFSKKSQLCTYLARFEFCNSLSTHQYICTSTSPINKENIKKWWERKCIRIIRWSYLLLIFLCMCPFSCWWWCNWCSSWSSSLFLSFSLSLFYFTLTWLDLVSFVVSNAAINMLIALICYVSTVIASTTNPGDLRDAFTFLKSNCNLR